MPREIPLGIKFLSSLKSTFFPNANFNALVWYRLSVLFLTFASYTFYHASRKPLSIVKSYFNQSCEHLVPPPDVDANDTTWCDWAPFYGPHAGTLLGTLDSAFLFAYAGGMFVSGFVAERMSLRYFLAVGMITSGIYCYLFGLAHKLEIHYVWYYVLVQIFGGIVQSSGWPGVVAVMGNWYGSSKKGLIMGLWNSHTSVGNIVGTLIASSLLKYDWGYSFMVPGVLVAGVGFIDFLFLVEHPEDVGLGSASRTSSEDKRENSTSYTEGCSVDREKRQESPPDSAVSLTKALFIPGVIEFSLCLFFSKLVCYTFLYWLPFYISVSTPYGADISADVSTIFDVGGIVGGIFAGALSDYSGKSASVCCFMLAVSLPMTLLYSVFGATSLLLNMVLLTSVGFFVNGPYALITTAVSAELGCHPSLTGNAKALATVTAIIDGTGSIGAAIGPLLAGIISSTGWQNVFYMLSAANLLAFVMLLRLVGREWRRSLAPSLGGPSIL